MSHTHVYVASYPGHPKQPGYEANTIQYIYTWQPALSLETKIARCLPYLPHLLRAGFKHLLSVLGEFRFKTCKHTHNLLQLHCHIHIQHLLWHHMWVTWLLKPHPQTTPTVHGFQDITIVGDAVVHYQVDMLPKHVPWGVVVSTAKLERGEKEVEREKREKEREEGGREGGREGGKREGDR